MSTDVVQVWWAVVIGTTFLLILGTGLVAALVISQRRSLRAERRRLEEQRLAEKRFRDLVTASPVPIVVESRRGIVYANSAAISLFDVPTAESLQNRSVMELLGTAGARELSGLLKSVMEDKEVVPRRELSIATSGGKERIIELTACPAMFGGEEAVQVVMVDLTDRKRTEEALARETERLAVTLRSINDGVISCDNRGIVRLVNKACETLTGWPSELAAGRPIEEVLKIQRERDAETVAEILKTVSSGDPLLGSAGYGYITTKNGSERIIEAEGASIRDPTGEPRGAVIALRDVTEKKRIEAEMIRAEKMETVGLLAARIAHDFNNILASVLADLSLAGSIIGESGEVAELLAEARTATLRAREITRQFQVFSTEERQIRTRVSLAAVLNETAAFTLRGSTVTRTVSLDDDLWCVDVDVGQMSQVFGNLLINAAQAMPSGGEITIIGENVAGDETGTNFPSPGRYVRVTVADHGCGISNEDMPRLFEPFFTTKPKGSGLGLASVHAIVCAHGGFVEVESELGHGASFSVYLPASVKTPEPVPEPERAMSLQGKRILIADDDDSVGRSMCRLLEHMGCEVDIAPDASTVMAVYQSAVQAGRRFDAVILDLVDSGGVSGADVARALTTTDGDVRVIAAGGHFDNRTFPPASQELFKALLFKPFTEDELRTAIIQALE